jgi:hypothetical protein
VRKTLAVAFNCTKGDSGGDFKPAAAATVTEGGVIVWDGKALVGSHPGLTNASDTGTGVAFEVTNGAFAFTSTAK